MRSHMKATALVLAMALSSTACDRSTGLEKRKAVELSLAVTQMQLASVEASIAEAPALVRTDANHFSVARHSLGAATVSVQSVEPYLEGFKVVFRIGNLTSADLGRVTGKVQWGKPGWFEKGNKEAPAGKLKDKEFTVASLRAGAYTNVEVIVTPAEPDEVRLMSVSLQPGSVSLSVPPFTR